MSDKSPYNKKSDEDLPSWMDKFFLKSRAIGRIIFGIVAFLVWFILGVPPSLIYACGIQTFIGTYSFFTRNPIIFLLIALLNIIVGIAIYFYPGNILLSAFHFLWSIRFFYGYNKYRSFKKVNNEKSCS